MRGSTITPTIYRQHAAISFFFFFGISMSFFLWTNKEKNSTTNGLSNVQHQAVPLRAFLSSLVVEGRDCRRRKVCCRKVRDEGAPGECQRCQRAGAHSWSASETTLRAKLAVLSPAASLAMTTYWPTSVTVAWGMVRVKVRPSWPSL